MELKPLGTFRMGSGRPVDTIRFESISGKQIKYQSIASDGLSMPVQSIVKINQEPHPDYFSALDKLAPFAIKVLDLGKHWQAVSTIGSLKLEWTYNNNTEKFTYKIQEIALARPSDISEIAIERFIKFGGIVIDDIPWEVRDYIEVIMDEAWLYCSGKKTAQLNLFEMVSVETAQKAVKIALQGMGVESYRIEDYLGEAGDSPSVEGFHEWQCEPEQQCLIRSEKALKEFRKKTIEPAAKSTRSKAKAVPA